MLRADPEIREGEEQVNPSSLEQGGPLLRTKLLIPPTRPNRVLRPRLIEQIDRGLGKALILVSAPAGYGKTTLVSSWLRETDIPSTWLSLDEGDNDPARFLQNLMAALQKIVPAVRSDLLSVLQGTQPASCDARLSILINEIAGSAPSFIFVLDDFHVIHAPPVLEILATLLEHLPPQMHLLLISRTDPSLPLFRLRARDQLVEIRAEQLRFTREETAVFLNEGMGLRLPVEDIAALEARTEGWIAGLQLAALSLQGCADTHTFVSEFTGSHYYIMDYLTEEVLKLQPEQVRSFLLHTSILTSMCGALCDAVMGIQESGARMDGESRLSIPDSQSILEDLERSNLFVIQLDEKRQWYRYHHLFADVLSLRLERLYPQQLPELHRRASIWYEQNAIIPEAIHHALMAKDPDRVAQLVEQHGCSLIMRGEGFTLLKWVEAVESYSLTHPWLAVLKAWALAFTGHLEDVEPALQSAEKLISSPEPTMQVRIMLGSMAAVRAYLANLHGAAPLAVEHAQEALEYLPVGNAFSCSLRSVAVSILGDSSWMVGNLQAARHAYLEAARGSRSAGNIHMTIIANTNLANVLMEQGDLHQAAGIYSDALQMATRTDGKKLPLVDRVYAGMGEITYEWNQLETAAGYIHQCNQLCQEWGNFNLLSRGYVMLARLERAMCNLEKAGAAIRSAERMIGGKRLSPTQSAWVKVACARWWIAQGSLERASDLVQQSGVTLDSLTREAGIPYQREHEVLLLIRLRLAEGDYETALSLAGHLLPLLEAARAAGRVIEVLGLQALAFQGKKDMQRALAVLEKAFSLARPEGYVRVFLDEGDPMAKLLYQAKSHRIGGAYTPELLSALGRVSGGELPPAQELIEPLTRRELELLRLIEAGCTNQDIAGRLVISIPTVKRHISNIYTKLGAKSRTQAVSLGRELRLLE